MLDTDAPAGPWQIGAFAARVGVRPERLRAWERRYGLLRPTRGPGGFRLYGPDDATRVAQMQAALTQGVPAAEAARTILTGAAAPAAITGGATSLTPERLLIAIRELDEDALQAEIDDALATWGIEPTLRDLLLPALRALGEGWQTGTFGITHEHFASHVIRGRLLALARHWGRGRGPLAVLACLPGERHDLSLIAFGLLLHGRGWRVLFLGGDTPVGTVADAARAAGADAVVLAAFNRRRVRSVMADLQALAAERPLRLCGPGADPALVAEAGGATLPGDVAQAAAALAG